MLDKTWMHNDNLQYQIDKDSKNMQIESNLSEERNDGEVHYMPSLHLVVIEVEILEQAKSICICITRKVELKNVFAHQLKPALLITVHHCGDGDIRPIDILQNKFQEILTEFQSL